MPYADPKQQRAYLTSYERRRRKQAKINGITHARVVEAVLYDPDSGNFYWNNPASRWYGKIAGKVCSGGYRSIAIDGGHYKAHRLAWFYVHGTWPHTIDHINGAVDDNRLANLRDVSVAQNMMNTKLRVNNKSGHKGVCRRNQKWISYIQIDRKFYRLGTFETMAAAIAARRQAEVDFGVSDFIRDASANGSS